MSDMCHVPRRTVPFDRKGYDTATWARESPLIPAGHAHSYQVVLIRTTFARLGSNLRFAQCLLGLPLNRLG